MTPIALVTGASRGLGRATALALARNNIRVVTSSRDGATDVAREIISAGGEALPLVLDVADVSSIESARGALIAAIGKEWDASSIDILVNNAGVGLFGPLGALTAEDFDMTFAINVRGPVLLTQALLPHLADGSRIVNVSSSLSRHVSPATSVYAASKKALEAITRSFALELGPRGIRVNSIAPGPTATDFNGGAMRDNDQVRQALSQQTALGGVGQPDEIADAIAALVSDEFRWVTGERIEVSGGVLM